MDNKLAEYKSEVWEHFWKHWQIMDCLGEMALTGQENTLKRRYFIIIIFLSNVCKRIKNSNCENVWH